MAHSHSRSCAPQGVVGYANMLITLDPTVVSRLAVPPPRSPGSSAYSSLCHLGISQALPPFLEDWLPHRGLPCCLKLLDNFKDQEHDPLSSLGSQSPDLIMMFFPAPTAQSGPGHCSELLLFWQWYSPTPNTLILIFPLYLFFKFHFLDISIFFSYTCLTPVSACFPFQVELHGLPLRQLFH